MKRKKVFIYGKHALAEALKSQSRAVDRVFLADSVRDEKLKAALARADIPVARLGKGKGFRADDLGVHQGVVARVDLKHLVQQYREFIKDINITPDTALLLLAEVQDPHNVGAVIRSAAAFGFAGVVLPERNQAPVTGTVVKVSAGMAFRIPLVSTPNVNTTLKDLKEKGFWTYGLAGEGDQSIVGEAFEKPTVLVLGNEADGLREKTRDACDTLLSIPMHPQCESLNAAASAAVAMYAWASKHPDVLG